MAAIPRTRGIDVERRWCDVHAIGLDQDGLAWGSPARRQQKLEREVVRLVAAVALGETDV